MNRWSWVSLLFFLAGPSFGADSTWILESSTLTYHAAHPMHHSSGSTSASKGKGLCQKNGCDFLIAVPVNTFDSGDSNRDLHMVQAVNGGVHPMIVVRTHLSGEPSPPGFKADLSVDFGGKEKIYPGVSFTVTTESGGRLSTRGTLPLVLTSHDVQRPSLLGVPIKDEVPVDIDTLWRRN